MVQIGQTVLNFVKTWNLFKIISNIHLAVNGKLLYSQNVWLLSDIAQFALTSHPAGRESNPMARLGVPQAGHSARVYGERYRWEQFAEIMAPY